MQTTERLIKNAEGKWLRLLQEHCKMIFSGTHLPSHDETHHARVWIHARNLLLEFAKKGQIFNEKDVEKLIIAVYFHDTGMSETIQKDHGTISRRIAKDFLKDKDLTPPEIEEILDAVENHDKKEYKSNTEAFGSANSLQALLNVSDDLDALGNIGIYRYFEIYYLRRIELKDIPDAILANLQGRFVHMKQFLAFAPGYLKQQNQRFQTTLNYFKDLNFQIKQVGDAPESLQGPLGVVNFIKEFVFNEKLHIQDACRKALLISGDLYVSNFFEKLEKESV
jgi:hypothetical protein